MSDSRQAGWLEDNPKSFVQPLWELSSTQKQKLGTRRTLSDGRSFIYVKNAATEIAAGYVVASAEMDYANTGNLAVTANVAANATSVGVTMGTTTKANTANAFAEGFLYFNSGGGNGATYKIKHHAAIASAANGTFYLYDKVRVAATTSSKCTVVKHPCKDVIIANVTLISGIIGVTQKVLTANYYGWIQTRGPACIKVYGTSTIGRTVYMAGANGCISVTANGSSEAYAPLGYNIANSANAEWTLIDLWIS